MEGSDADKVILVASPVQISIGLLFITGKGLTKIVTEKTGLEQPFANALATTV